MTTKSKDKANSNDAEPKINEALRLLTEIETHIDQGYLGSATECYHLACQEFEKYRLKKECLWQKSNFSQEEIESELVRIGSGLILLKSFYIKSGAKLKR
jgi:hypothetical protein